ncbi:hypothetical protein INT48_004817 [Thamnidium elegans]|uniref:EF-hand domain-containing protein n=1 Tax=Thamnidium elegans TaxID=101142 RepID=A0A8H7SMQ4_9FUNG|nr:hypothetical protein INT48_004817 [Thamnidium elegans]
MSDQINSTQLAEFKETFALFDKDNNGSINISELGAVMQSLGYNATDQELKDMISEVDVNVSVIIINDNVWEKKLTKKKKKKRMSGAADTEDDLLDAFKVFDKDNDGYITPDELRQVMKQLGQKLSEQEVDEMIKEADADSDGKIDYKEFGKMMVR